MSRTISPSTRTRGPRASNRLYGSRESSSSFAFAVDPATLPANLRPTHVSLFDGSLQGMARTDRPAFCFQGHPEASPGPHDIGYLFDRFVKLMDDKNA